MDNSNSSPTDRIHSWFEHSPKAQQVYRRVSADLDAVVEWVESKTSGLREKIAPIIDPVREAAPDPVPDPASEPGLTQEEQVVLETNEPTSETEPGATGQGAPGRSDPGATHPST